MSGASRRWGFRARLTALIASVFILGGTVLLTVQYVLVRQLLASGLRTIADCAGDESTGIEIDGPAPDSVVGVVCDGDTIDGAGVVEVSIQQTSSLSDEVLSGLLLWSIVVLVVFAALAVVAAWWLSKRSLGRIARITETTRAITRDDLHRRLDLPGPADEVKELGDTIDGMLDRLDDAFARQERFAAAASHELRTPLTTTRAALEIPLEQGRFPTDVEPDVRRALAANERSEHLIGALLTLARTAHAATRPGTVDLAVLVDEAIDQHRAHARERGIEIVVVGGHVRVAADETLAGIAIGNLIENAVRHNREGGVVRITIVEGVRGADPGARGAGLIIENDGHPLTDAEVGHLTEPFHRGDQTRLAGPGTGLGLTLAEAAVEAFGAELSLAPRAAGGLLARLTFGAAAAR